MNLDEHEIGNRKCSECMREYERPEDILEVCKCGGLIHFEYTGEDCTEDFEDCWDTHDFFCDRCGYDFHRKNI